MGTSGRDWDGTGGRVEALEALRGTGGTGGHWEHCRDSGGSRGHWDVLGSTGLYWADPISPTAAYPAAYGLVSPAFAPPGPLLAPPPPPQQQQREGEEPPKPSLDPETPSRTPQTS